MTIQDSDMVKVPSKKPVGHRTPEIDTSGNFVCAAISIFFLLFSFCLS